MDEILFTTDDGEEIPFIIVEQTTIAGTNYLLVTENDEDEADAYILREIVDEEDQLTYEMVDDEEQLTALAKVFEELIDDVDIEM